MPKTRIPRRSEVAERLLGPVETRGKTDLRLPVALLEQVDSICGVLGVPKNAFFALAAAQLCVALAPMDRRAKNREKLYRDLEKALAAMLLEVRKQHPRVARRARVLIPVVPQR